MKKVYEYKKDDVWTVDELIEFAKRDLKKSKNFRPGFLRVKMTPEDAKKFYDFFYKSNRRVTDSKAVEWKNIFEQGEYEENIGCPIAINTEGYFLNGHHRVFGLSLASIKKPVIFELLIGVNTSYYLDTGKRRTVLDTTKMFFSLENEVIDIIDSDIGKALNVLCNFENSSRAHNIAFLHNIGENASEELKVLREAINPKICTKKNKISAAGCEAAIIDQFFKGNINTNDIKAFTTCALLYSQAYEAQAKGNAMEFNKLLEEAKSFEKDAFQTSLVILSLVMALSNLGGGGGVNKRKFCLTEKAINNIVSGKDSDVKLGDSVFAEAEMKSLIDERFDFNNLPNYDIEHVREGDYCHILKVA